MINRSVRNYVAADSITIGRGPDVVGRGSTCIARGSDGFGHGPSLIERRVTLWLLT